MLAKKEKKKPFCLNLSNQTSVILGWQKNSKCLGGGGGCKPLNLQNLLFTYIRSGLVQCPKREMRQWYGMSKPEIHNIHVLVTAWCGSLTVYSIKHAVWTIKPKKYKLFWRWVTVSVWAVNKGVNIQEGYKILMRRRKHLVHVDVCTLILFSDFKCKYFIPNIITES